MTYSDSAYVYEELVGSKVPPEFNKPDKVRRGALCLSIFVILLAVIALAIAGVVLAVTLSQTTDDPNNRDQFHAFPVQSVSRGLNNQRTNLLNSVVGIPSSASWTSSAHAVGAELTPTNLGVIVLYHRLSSSTSTLAAVSMETGEKLPSEVSIHSTKDNESAFMLMYQSSHKDKNYGILVTSGCEISEFIVTPYGISQATTYVTHSLEHCTYGSIDKSGEYAIIGNQVEMFYYHITTNEVMWSTHKVQHPLLTSHGIVGAGSPYHVYGIDLHTGKEMWNVLVAAKNEAFVSEGAVSESEEYYYFTTSICDDDDGGCIPQIYCINIKRGLMLWSKDLIFSTGGIESILHPPSIISSPAEYPNESHIVIVTVNEYMYAYTSSSQRLWATEIGSHSISGITAHGIIILDNGQLYSSTGKHVGHASASAIADSSFIDRNTNVYGIKGGFAFAYPTHDQ